LPEEGRRRPPGGMIRKGVTMKSTEPAKNSFTFFHYTGTVII